MSKQDQEGCVKEPRAFLTKEQEEDIENRRRVIIKNRAMRAIKSGNTKLYKKILDRV